MIDPETELWLINRRHEELRRQAAREGMARRHRQSQRERTAGPVTWLAGLLRRLRPRGAHREHTWGGHGPA